ncbi:MAG: dual specificity protein phosphatase family protein [Deltaproteobacteria bacterium]|nr:dual specificity protein phosphatase family protein [Deltaproteobacteria bacterium]
MNRTIKHLGGPLRTSGFASFFERNPGLSAYWVRQDRVMAGAYPGSPDASDARRKIRWLLERGIRRFADLTEEHEQTGRGSPLLPYAHLLAAEAGRAGIAAEHCRFPIEDMGVPRREQLGEILDYLDGAEAGQEPAYVHCLGGRGRTGTVVACYLLRNSARRSNPLTAEEALAELTSLRRSQGVPDPLDSPQTSVQFDFVKSWSDKDG